MSGIPVNIRNYIDQEVRVPRRTPLLPVFEAVHNALDAIVERGTQGTVSIRVERHPAETDGSRGAPFRFIVKDDGIGLDDDNTAGFDVLSSVRKKSRGGKGRGRFTYLRVFDEVTIDSNFDRGGRRYKRAFRFGFDYKGCPTQGLPTSDPVGTTLTLSAMSPDFARYVPKDAAILAREFITHFLPVLLSRPGPAIILDDGKAEDLASLVKNELFVSSEPDPFSIGDRTFDLQHVRLRPRRGLRHRLVMAAAAREVDGVDLEKHIPTLSPKPLEVTDTDEGYLVFGIVQGDYLDEIADPHRLSFRDDMETGDASPDAAEQSQADMLGDPLSVAQVRRSAISRIRDKIAPQLEQAVKDRTDAITNYIRRDGMGYHFLRGRIPDLAEKLRSTEDHVIEAVLHQAAYEERSDRRTKVEQLLKATPKEKTEETYFDRWHAIVADLSDEAKSDLADYVAHRRAIIDLAEDLLRTTPEGTYRREEIVHSILFPKGKQSGEVGYEQQNLWLVDERLSFHEHLFSDVSVRRMSKGADPSLLRPDLTIFESGFAAFHDGGAVVSQVVLIELKQPARDDVSRDDPIKKAIEYVDRLKSGKAKTEGGAVIDVDDDALTTVYLLNDWTADFRKLLRLYNFVPLPGDSAEYVYRERDKIMMIAISFKRLIENARRRNRIFFRKLGIEN